MTEESNPQYGGLVRSCQVGNVMSSLEKTVTEENETQKPKYDVFSICGASERQN